MYNPLPDTDYSMKIDILGVKIDRIGFDEAVELITSYTKDGDRHYVVTANPEMVVEAQRNGAFRDAINRADLVVPDGVGLLAAADYLQKQQGMQRNFIRRLIDLKLSLLKILFARQSFTNLSESVSGADLVLALADWTHKKKETDVSFVLIGGAEGEAQGAAEYLRKKYPGLSVIANSGPQHLLQASQSEIEEVLHPIANITQAFTFVAFGHPKQELFITDHLKQLPFGVAIGVGGTFAYLAGTKHRAPRPLRKLGLEWVWRVVIEPKRINRIITATIVFPLLVFRAKPTAQG